MIRLAKARSHILFCDVDINPDHVAYLNIYQNFVLSAMKMHGYIRTWRINVHKSIKFIRSASDYISCLLMSVLKTLLDTIRDMINYTYSSIQSKSRGPLAKRNGARCNIQKLHVLW
jgi:hypothetical protein